MKIDTLPKVHLREVTIEDVEDRYQWCLDKAIVHLPLNNFN